MISTKSLLYQAIVAFSATTLLFSCDVTGQNRVKGNGNVIKEERPVGTFHKLKVEGDMNVYVTMGPAKAAVIQAEDNIAKIIELREEDDRLVVTYKRGYSVSSHKELNVYLTTPEIEEASLAGSGDLNLSGAFTSHSDVKFNLSGSGNLRGEITAPAVKASIAGSGDMSLRGETKELKVSIAGSGNFRADQLLSEEVNVNIAGSGDADVFASVKLDAKIAGSGNINYDGTPQISSSVAGSGTVRKR